MKKIPTTPSVFTFYLSVLGLLGTQFTFFIEKKLHNPFFLLALPILLLLSLCLFFRYHLLFYILIFCIPLSIAWEFPNLKLSVLLPSEPLIGLTTVLFLFQFFFWGNALRSRFLLEPLSRIVLIYLFSISISTIFSPMPVVSIKALIVRFCYVISFFIVTQQLGKQFENWRIFYSAYTLSFLVVIAWVWLQHASYGFSKDTSGLVTRPFYADHTIYSTCASVLLPFWVAFFLQKKSQWFYRLVYAIIVLVLLLAIFLAASRAAWLSLGITIIFFTYLLFKLPFRYILYISGIAAVALGLFKDNIAEKLKSNRIDSNAKKSGAIEQIQSISNIRSDWSNLERINRWSCAFRMFLERPITGFGIGTYQFTYVSFQREKEMTPISVRNPYSSHIINGGNAHSEFFNLLSEAGFLGGLSWLLLFIISMKQGFELCYQTAIPTQEKGLIYASVCGLFIYFCNGTFNSFLDTDKAAFLFWSNLALIASFWQRYIKSSYNEQKNFFSYWLHGLGQNNTR
ncbi:MAG: O-antigen ligase family protein [Bacteroidia bacterium]|nr:O-antigen ligase family protein [Bacteroidia bacterium]MDW8159276.1 O-antigen ligase family protein [Bacteroidia bacterium]